MFRLRYAMCFRREIAPCEFNDSKSKLQMGINEGGKMPDWIPQDQFTTVDTAQSVRP